MRLNKWLVIFMLLLNTSISLLALWKGMSAQTVATFDKDRIVKEFVTQLSNQNKTEEENTQISAKFAKKLKKAIELYTNEHHCLILKKDSAMSTQDDASSEIGKIVSALMREKS